ncbi:MAG: DUF721 domain-containing protein [Candidatus Bipolaricaulaceae bacterium]
MYKRELQEWLSPLLQRWGLQGALTQQAAVFAWDQAVGGQLAHLARPLYVEGGTLHLAVSSHVAAAELRLVADKLLQRLGGVGTEVRVSRLRFHVVPTAPRRAAVAPLEPTEADWRTAQAAIPQGLGDELRRRLVGIAARATARDRAVLAAGGQRCRCCGVAFLGEGRFCPCCLVGAEKES